MRISDISNFMDSVEIKSDGEFEIFGLVNTNINKKIISFIEDKKYIDDMSSNVSCVFIKKELQEFVPQGLGIIVCENPKIEFYKLHNYLCNNSKDYIRENFKTRIGLGSKISKKSTISEYNVCIGKNVTIEENVIIRKNTTIGDNSIIRAGSIIGGEGLQFLRIGKESILPVKHGGGVIIGGNVEIQQSCCIDKAVFPWDDTIIGEYTKFDNFIHIGHAVKIGERCMFAANSTVAGVTTIGDDCWIGLSSTISNCLKIGNNVNIKIGSIVISDIKDGESVAARPAIPLRI